jgi:hypothetical protein
VLGEQHRQTAPAAKQCFKSDQASRAKSNGLTTDDRTISITRTLSRASMARRRARRASAKATPTPTKGTIAAITHMNTAMFTPILVHVTLNMHI